MNFKMQAEMIQNEIVTWRRELHQIPEVDNNTFETAKMIVRFLKNIGIPETDIRTMVNGADVVAMIHGKEQKNVSEFV